MNNIKISQILLSKTNTAGRTEGKAFDDLVASVKEKGVLVPILVRPLGHNFELVAGERRMAAAKQAGLTEIPANVQKMTDVEAREAQIVENLQRQDIHPLDEGELYRALIEKSKPRYEVKDVAAKVGKSETHVRQRLALTNLSAKAAKLFRAGKLTPSSAVLIARIEDAATQDKVISDAGEYRMNDADRLRTLIQEHIYKSLNSKPWAKDAKLAEMVGDKVGHVSLFGDKEAGTDPVAYATQMAAFIEIKMREAKEKGIDMVRISTQYGKPQGKGTLDQDAYRVLYSKDDMKETKTKLKGIVSEGSDLGKIFWITTDKREMSASGLYKPTAKEKAARKRELAAQKKRAAGYVAAFKKAIGKIKYPLPQKQLDALFDFAFYSRGVSVQMEIPYLLGIELVRKEEEVYGTKKKRMRVDYTETLRAYAGDDALKKLSLIFALLMPKPGEYYMKEFNAAVKKL